MLEVIALMAAVLALAAVAWHRTTATTRAGPNHFKINLEGFRRIRRSPRPARGT